MSEMLGQVLAAVSGLGTRFDAIDTRLDAIDTRLDAMDKRLDALDTRLDNLNGEVVRLRVETMGRLDRQQNLLTQIKDDMQVNIAAADDTRDKLRSFQNEQHNLTHQVSVIHRRLLQLEQRFDAREGGA